MHYEMLNINKLLNQQTIGIKEILVLSTVTLGELIILIIMLTTASGGLSEWKNRKQEILMGSKGEEYGS